MKPQDTARPFVPALTPPSHLELSENSQQVLRKRYLRRGLDGQPAETIEGMFRRVARAVAEPDAAHGYDSKSTEDSFYALLTDLRFFPNSPTFTGAGTPLGQLAACFTAGMRVTTENGVKPIIDLRPGDRVLTHLGRYRPVTEVFQRAYQDELLRIKVDLIGTTLEVTPEHPILTPGGWVKAGELKVGDAVAIGLPVGERPAATFDLAQLVYADELEVQAETANARDTAQVSLPPLQSRRLVEAAFGKTLPEPDPRYIRNTVRREEGQVFFRIASIEADDFTGTVYNCEVDEDHSYVTEGVVVHNCFVLPISDDMGRESAGIFQTLRDAALIQQTGGGNGFSFSSLRPKGDSVASSAGVATGPRT